MPGSPCTTMECSVPSARSAPAMSSRRPASATPITWRPARAGLANGPTRFITVGTAISRRTGPTCRMAGCIVGANMNTMPARSRTSRIRVGGTSIAMPSASSTSALPQFDVKERLPCFAIRTPAPAASRAAAVEMLNVATAPPPVPHVSTSSAGSRASSTSMAPRMAVAAPATSSAVSPFTRSPISNAATWAGDPSPPITLANAAADSAAVSEPARASLTRAARSAPGLSVTDCPEEPFGQFGLPGHERDDESE